MNDTIRRAIAAAIAAGIIALNNKLGLNMGPAEISAIVGLALAYIGQSALKSIKSLSVVPAVVETAEQADQAMGLEEKK